MAIQTDSGAEGSTEKSGGKRDEDMKGAFSCLLDHYLGCYDDNKDALSRVAESFIPDWKERAATFSPVSALRRIPSNGDREVEPKSDAVSVKQP